MGGLLRLKSGEARLAEDTFERQLRRRQNGLSSGLVIAGLRCCRRGSVVHSSRWEGNDGHRSGGPPGHHRSWQTNAHHAGVARGAAEACGHPPVAPRCPWSDAVTMYTGLVAHVCLLFLILGSVLIRLITGCCLREFGTSRLWTD